MTGPERPILVVGESLGDIVKASDGAIVEHSGGSPANVAVALSRLGATVEITTAYAEDRLGRLVETYFSESGVGLAGDPHVVGHTSSAVATIDETGAATYLFDIAGDLPVPTPTAAPMLVHTGSLGAVLEPGARLVLDTIARLAPTATVSYDINARPGATGVSADLVRQVEAIAAASDVVKASDEDLEGLYPGREVALSAHHLLDLGAGAVVEARGAQGARCHTARGRIDCPSERVRVVDTIGAGDSFCAAMLDGLRRRGLLGAENRDALRSLPLDVWSQVLARATRAAAITVSRQGADTPTSAELDAT